MESKWPDGAFPYILRLLFCFTERSGSFSAHSSLTHSCTLTFPQWPFENLVSWYVPKHLTVCSSQLWVHSSSGFISVTDTLSVAGSSSGDLFIKEQHMFVRHSRSTQRRVNPVFVLLFCNSSGFTLTHKLEYCNSIHALWTVCFTLAGEWETQCDEDFVLRILWAHLHLNMLIHEQLRSLPTASSPPSPCVPFQSVCFLRGCTAKECASKSRQWTK